MNGLDRALVYLTAMSRARRRVARALHIVRKVFDDGPASAAIEEIARWLEEFHPHSLVELDYGGLVHLLDDETLSADTSVAEIAEALERLSERRRAGLWRVLRAGRRPLADDRRARARQLNPSLGGRLNGWSQRATAHLVPQWSRQAISDKPG